MRGIALDSSEFIKANANLSLISACPQGINRSIETIFTHIGVITSVMLEYEARVVDLRNNKTLCYAETSNTVCGASVLLFSQQNIPSSRPIHTRLKSPTLIQYDYRHPSARASAKNRGTEPDMPKQDNSLQ